MWVADGNFKADHVRQAVGTEEFWLLDGAGMMPNRAEYLAFLSTAIERNTVGDFNWPRRLLGLLPSRKPHVKINFGRSNCLCWDQRPVM